MAHPRADDHAVSAEATRAPAVGALSLPLARRAVCEALGTFFLVFAGTGAMIVNDWSGGVVTHAGVAVTWGLVVLALIVALGDLSGAHMNPAVSIAFAAEGAFPWRAVPVYAAAQVFGAVAASSLWRVVLPAAGTFGATVPTGEAWRSALLEAVLTWALMLVVLSVSRGPKERGILAGIAVGSVVALEAMFAGPICGASMNPARSIGPAVVGSLASGGGSGGGGAALGALWVYVLGPVAGALAAVPTWRVLSARPGGG